MIADLLRKYEDAESDIQGHLARLHALVVEVGAQTVVELGVRTGRSTVALLAGVERTGGRVWSCDLNAPGIPAEVVDHPQWTFVRGDDVTVVDQAPRPIDVLFIDTSHEYEHTLAELNAYAPLVRSGGVVVLHDTNPALWPECAQAVWDWVAARPVLPRLEVHDHDNGLTIVWLP